MERITLSAIRHFKARWRENVKCIPFQKLSFADWRKT